VATVGVNEAAAKQTGMRILIANLWVFLHLRIAVNGTVQRDQMMATSPTAA
jgi:hypothetical protein